MELVRGDLDSDDVVALLRAHLANMAGHSPACSIHALPHEALRGPDVTFWSVREAGELRGCGALKELDPTHGEVKSMRTVDGHLRRGVASLVLREIIAEARRRGYRRLSLETGSMAAFEPACTLYRRFGFGSCGPFGEYRDDPNSRFMTLALGA